jgi:hypothetical protein
MFFIKTDYLIYYPLNFSCVRGRWNYVCPYAGNIFAFKQWTVIKYGEYLQDWLSLLFTQLFPAFWCGQFFFQFEALSVGVKIE